MNAGRMPRRCACRECVRVAWFVRCDSDATVRSRWTYPRCWGVYRRFDGISACNMGLTKLRSVRARATTRSLSLNILSIFAGHVGTFKSDVSPNVLSTCFVCHIRTPTATRASPALGFPTPRNHAHPPPPRSSSSAPRRDR
eukprot:2544224-Rhodomonas_salina.1